MAEALERDRNDLPLYGYDLTEEVYRVGNLIWNTDTLAWEKATGSLGAGGAVEVTNWPTTQQVNDLSNPLGSYKISDMDTSGDPSYFGYVDADGNWYIAELNDASGTMRYVKGSSGYTTAWTNRATQTYGYYNAVF